MFECFSNVVLPAQESACENQTRALILNKHLFDVKQT